jgi:hypothetical protein
MTEMFDDFGESAGGISPEGQRHLDTKAELEGTDWDLLATVHADAYIESQSHEDFEALLGAAAMALKRSETKRQIKALDRQFGL